ncbi:MAG: DUF2849 domain-containing protein [Hyphomicrobiaceae bacterium]
MVQAKDIRQVLTANHLKGGHVVFLGEGGSWTAWIDEAVVARTRERAAELESKGTEQTTLNIVVGAYLVDVVEDDGKIRAAHIREHLRTLGPSVRPDLGKQADSQQPDVRQGPAFI